MSAAQQAAWFNQTYDAVKAEVQKAIVGQEQVVDGVLMGLAANGHILLEGMPGLGKTLLVRSLSQVLQTKFSRIQFTPDLMPADVTGTNVLADGAFQFRKGPIFANIVLADEINRATPKTQAAMLEAMQERSVTTAGQRLDLEEPFLVMATQNPIEQEGTYPLPEAQLDRFFLKLLVPFPGREELAAIVTRTTGDVAQPLQQVGTGADVIAMRDIVRQVPVSESVLDFALSLVLATHPGSGDAAPLTARYVRYGSSPRGAQAIVTAGKIMSLRHGRFNVSKEDLVAVAKPCLRHRIGINFEAEADGVSVDHVLDDVVGAVQKQDRDPIKV